MKTKILILTILLLPGFFSFAQRRESKPVRFEKIADGIYEILDGNGARGGVCIGDSEVLLIDSKMDKASVDQTIKVLREITDKPINYLINTHSDGDHINGNQFFSKDITFIAHENCRKDFFLPGRDGGPSKWSNENLAPFVPKLTFKDKMELMVGDKKLELWYFGVGHTTGDAVVYFPKEKTAFLGDQIFLDRVQLIHKHKNGNSFEHIKTLSRMLNTLDVENYCSGHSNITNREGIMDHIYQMKKRQMKVKSLIDQEKKLKEIQANFSKEESALVATIYKEITEEGY